MYSKYIGIPFKDHGRDFDGCDCWGLVRLIYQNEYGIFLPRYDTAYTTTKDRISVSNFALREAQNWIEVSDKKEGDVILFRVLGLPLHVGLVIDKHYMIHILKGIDSSIEKFESPIWKKRILGVYRHAKFC